MLGYHADWWSLCGCVATFYPDNPWKRVAGRLAMWCRLYVIYYTYNLSYTTLIEMTTVDVAVYMMQYCIFSNISQCGVCCGLVTLSGCDCRLS